MRRLNYSPIAVGDPVICLTCGCTMTATSAMVRWHKYICMPCEAKRCVERRRNTPDSIRAAGKRYVATEKGRAVRAQSSRKYSASNPEKCLAHRKANDAIKRGTLTRLPCEVCGAMPSEAHHDDYSKPLDVRWLCLPHHRELHKSAATKGGE